MASFKILETQFQMFIKSRMYLDDKYVVMTRNYFLQYTQLAIPEFRDTLIQHMESVKKSINERAKHKREYDISVNRRQIQTTEGKVDTGKVMDASLVHIESSGTTLKEQDTSSRSGNDAHADDADIRPIYDEEPMAEYECKQTLDVSAGTLNIHAGTSLNPTKEGLRVCSELEIHNHSNELSKLVPKVVPPADKTATSRQELELLFHHHITMLRSLVVVYDRIYAFQIGYASSNEDSEPTVVYYSKLMQGPIHQGVVKSGSRRNEDKNSRLRYGEYVVELQITNFMFDIADEFNIVVVDAIRSLCLKFPIKYRTLMNFLSYILREEGGFEYKKAIVDSIVILMITAGPIASISFTSPPSKDQVTPRKVPEPHPHPSPASSR
ncbi:hypothetical protein Tco_0683122 [Tanacetum coccineum]|uniref:Uncharacterized protein n=1 Tax=Tanacetum coccineum TaxID=301880 RepID=A0ABQ4XU93_9ASTR